MNVVAVIPARMGSTRVPGKPLAVLCGKPMIQHVYERTCAIKGLDFVTVATPDRQIADVVWGFGGNAVVTKAEHATGTDAIAEVVRWWHADIVVNVQGDLPYFHPRMVEEAIQALTATPAASMATVKTPIVDPAQLHSANVVKVITDCSGYALAFSRSAIPYHRKTDTAPLFPLGYRHIGLYVYWRSFLLLLTEYAQTPLEQCESLEQLRVLEYGHRIIVSETTQPTIEVDTPEDLVRAREALLSGSESA